MDHAELRMHCLKLAVELGPQVGATLSAADQLLSFLTATSHSNADKVQETIEADPLPVAAAEPASVDAIAACGTALMIPEGGDLSDAAPLHEAAPAEPSVSVEHTPPVTEETAVVTSDAVVASEVEAVAADEAQVVDAAANTNDEVVSEQLAPEITSAVPVSDAVAMVEPEAPHSS